MEKTKLGISVSLAAALCWLLGYYGGLVITGLFAGYILLKEENEWLKKSALKVVVLTLAFSVLNTVIYLLPNLLNIVSSFLEIFRVSFYLSFIDRIMNFISNVVSIIKLVVFALMTVMALGNKDTKLPLVDDLLDKLLAKHV